jgi:CYTH domain-containing protein
MEIERKYLIHSIPFSLDTYPFHEIEQAYLCTNPVVRIRKQDDSYILTYKGKGLMVREEYNLPLNEDAYHHLLQKADGVVIKKRRYLIPYSLEEHSYTIELDIFSGTYKGLQLAEVEFETESDCNTFMPPEWFGEDVTFSKKYHNSTLSAVNSEKTVE